MPEYRFYNLEQNGQAVICRIHLTLENDDDAIEQARKLTIGETVEIWQGDWLVTTLAFAASAPDVAACAMQRG
jgi:hypothetical protein